MPTMTFAQSAGTEDGSVWLLGPAYPPTGTPSRDMVYVENYAIRDLSGGNYRVHNALNRWDTSGIPDNATITGATARMWIIDRQDTQVRNLTADPYLFDGTSADHSLAAQTGALSAYPVANLPDPGSVDIPLQNAALWVNKSGMTGLRWHIDGGQPAGQEWVVFAAQEAPEADPLLIVDYFIPGTKVDTFNIATGANDRWVSRAGGYPPTGSITLDAADTIVYIERTLSAGVTNGLLRWDTSSIPDNATISAATLRMQGIAIPGTEAGISYAGEYYAWTTAATTDYALDPTGALAFSVLASTLTLPGSVDFVFTDLTGISKTGFTGLRLHHTKATAPTQNNTSQWAALEHATQPEARLLVTYTVPPSLYSYDFTGTNGAAWPSPWTATQGTVEIQGNRGRLQNATAANWSAASARYNSAANPIANFDLTGTLYVPTLVPDSYFSIFFHDDYAGTRDAFEIYLPTGQAYVKHWVSGVDQGGYGDSNAALAITPGVGRKFRLQAVGDSLRYKIWNEGSSEPTAWTIDFTAPSLPAGYLTVSYNDEPVAINYLELDDVTIDLAPPATFSIATGADDVYVTRNSNAGYPPVVAVTRNTTVTNVSPERSYYGGAAYQVANGEMRWDTSAIPDNATIIAATLRGDLVDTSVSADGLSWTAEWYVFDGTDSDWADPGGTSARAAMPISRLPSGTQTNQDFPLIGFAGGINKSGMSGLRLSITQRAGNAAPTGSNYFYIASDDHATLSGPRLIVYYVVLGPYSYDFTSTDGAPWPYPWISAGGTNTIQSNQGRLQKQNTAWGPAIVNWGTNVFADFEILVDVTRRANASTNQYLIIDSRMVGSDYYNFGPDLFATSGNVVISKWVGGVQTAVSGSASSYTFPVDTAVRIRYRVVGSNFKYKLWDPASAEPGSWAVECTDSSLTAAGTFRLGFTEGTAAQTFVDVDNATIEPLDEGRPNAIVAQSNLGGFAWDIADDPDTPDASWLTSF